MEQVRSAFELMHYISHTAVATEVGTSPASVYRTLTNTLGKWKVCAQWIPHVLNIDQRVMRVLLVTTYLLHWRNGGSAFLGHILTVDKSWMCLFDHQLKWQNADWHAPTSPSKKIARHSRGEIEVMHVLFFSQNRLVLYHLMPVGMTVSGKYYCTPLQDKVR